MERRNYDNILERNRGRHIRAVETTSINHSIAFLKNNAALTAYQEQLDTCSALGTHTSRSHSATLQTVVASVRVVSDRKRCRRWSSSWVSNELFMPIKERIGPRVWGVAHHYWNCSKTCWRILEQRIRWSCKECQESFLGGVPAKRSSSIQSTNSWKNGRCERYRHYNWSLLMINDDQWWTLW